MKALDSDFLSFFIDIFYRLTFKLVDGRINIGNGMELTIGMPLSGFFAHEIT